MRVCLLTKLGFNTLEKVHMAHRYLVRHNGPTHEALISATKLADQFRIDENANRVYTTRA